MHTNQIFLLFLPLINSCSILKKRCRLSEKKKTAYDKSEIFSDFVTFFNTLFSV